MLFLRNQKFVGKVKYSKLKFDGTTPKNYFVGSELNVISSINLKDGSIGKLQGCIIACSLATGT